MEDVLDPRVAEHDMALDLPLPAPALSFGCGAGVLRDGLQLPVLDDVGDKTFLVLDLHRFENAAVRIDADEE